MLAFAVNKTLAFAVPQQQLIFFEKIVGAPLCHLNWEKKQVPITP